MTNVSTEMRTWRTPSWAHLLLRSLLQPTGALLQALGKPAGNQRAPGAGRPPSSDDMALSPRPTRRPGRAEDATRRPSVTPGDWMTPLRSLRAAGPWLPPPAWTVLAGPRAAAEAARWRPTLGSPVVPGSPEPWSHRGLCSKGSVCSSDQSLTRGLAPGPSCAGPGRGVTLGGLQLPLSKSGQTGKGHFTSGARSRLHK